MSNPEPKFSKTVWILKDIKKKSSWDIIKVLSRIDEKPVLFDFGAGNVLVIRYSAETIDGLVNLFIPYVNSFIKKIAEGKYFELGAKRCYNYEMPEAKTNEWIIYVNRIKNLTPVNLKLGDRIEWQSSAKTKEIDFPFDENWLERSLPIKNNLADCKRFFENLDDIDPDTLLSLPLKIVKLQLGPQIEVTETTGSVIKNYEFVSLTHNKVLVRLYVPYFLRDMAKSLNEKLSQFNLVINRLKIFYKRTTEETYAGLLWDPTLSGFVLMPKKPEENSWEVKEGKDIFLKFGGENALQDLLNYHKKLENELSKAQKEADWKFLKGIEHFENKRKPKNPKGKPMSDEEYDFDDF